jgi:hypothetical protein
VQWYNQWFSRHRYKISRRGPEFMKIYAQVFFDTLSKLTTPIAVPITPPMSNHVALSVAEPVKNREISELVESYALMPRIRRRMPAARTAIEIALFIDTPPVYGNLNCVLESLHGPSSLNHSDQDHDYGYDQKNVDESPHRGGGEQSKEPQHDKNDSNGIQHGKFPFCFEQLFNDCSHTLLRQVVVPE